MRGGKCGKPTSNSLSFLTNIRWTLHLPHIGRGCRPANITPALLSRIVHKRRNLPLFSRRPSIGHWKIEHQDHKFTACISVTDTDDSTAQGNIKEWGHTNKSKSTNGHTKHKPRLNTQTKYCSTVTRPTRSRLATFWYVFDLVNGAN